MNPKVIAFYLPQYHPTPDNDKWWGKGFTEWTNVGKAKPLFPGHYQPKVPADLGYYDLRLPEVRDAQAKLAKEAGIYGFCYYHYWFGNGKEELELPFNEVLRLCNPDFPFMLCWANESWHSKFWNIDGTIKKKLLIEQTYPGEEDIINHFYRLLPAFKDSRYIKIDDKPAFMIYKPFDCPDISDLIKSWNQLAKKNGLNGIFFITQQWIDLSQKNFNNLREIGFDAINSLRMYNAIWSRRKKIGIFLNKVSRKIFPRPDVVDIRKINQYFISEDDLAPDIFPTLVPNFDHTPRSGNGGLVLTHSTPEQFDRQIQRFLELVSKKEDDRQIIFLKSWNEWGEGNYIEPDLKFRNGYLDVLKKYFY